MSNPEQTHGGAQPGNDNARHTGWTSRLDPAPTAEILAAADTAVSAIIPGADPEEIAAAFATLRRAERALRFRREHAAALIVRQSIDLARQYLRDGIPPAPDRDDALYAPQSVPNEATGYPLPPPPETFAGGWESPTPARVAYGHRPSRGHGTFPN